MTKRVRGFTDQEKEAMRERAGEISGAGKGETAVLAKIRAMGVRDRQIAERIHFLIKKHAPSLNPKTWYGMPAYANLEGKVVCFFQASEKFKTRYATFGFSDTATIDEGDMWPTAFAIKKFTRAEEDRIVSLIEKAVK